MQTVRFYCDLDRVRTGGGLMSIQPPGSVWAQVERALAVAEPAKYRLTFFVEKKRRPRTTGERSQNHRINGHVQVLCMETGNDFYFMKEWMKYKAIRRGYPFDTAPDGTVIPWSESRLDTIQAGHLCDEINQFAAENGIRLPEYPDAHA